MNLETQLGGFGAIYPVLREMEEARFFPSGGGIVFRGIPLESADIQDDTIIFLLSPYTRMPGAYVAIPVKEWSTITSTSVQRFEPNFRPSQYVEPIKKEEPEPIWTPTNIRNRKLRD